MNKLLILMVLFCGLTSCTFGVKSYLYNNSKELIVLSGCEEDVAIKAGENLNFIACDNLVIKTKSSTYKYFDFVPLSNHLDKISDYVENGVGTNFVVVYFQFNDDGKIYIAKKNDLPIKIYNNQPEGFPVLGNI
jgi:hypothetical protein